MLYIWYRYGMVYNIQVLYQIPYIDLTRFKQNKKIYIYIVCDLFKHNIIIEHVNKLNNI